MSVKDENLIEKIKTHLIHTISETNGVSLNHTLELMSYNYTINQDPQLMRLLNEFRRLITAFQKDEVDISTLIGHPFSIGLKRFFKEFPIPFHEEHIHLTGSLSADFIFPKIKKLLDGPQKKLIEKKITEVYGKDALPINSREDIDKLIRLKDGEQFKTYLKILYLAKLILNSKKAHKEAAYHMAKELYEKYNVGKIRLKFTLSRTTGISEEIVPGQDKLTEEDVVLGLYEGFMKFKDEFPKFDFVLSPSFRNSRC